MTRPSRDLDKKMLLAGRELIPACGISGLKVRDVAKKAGANPGMFIYHFGTKDKYIEDLIKDIYDEFFLNFKLESEMGKNELERLKNAVTSVGMFIRDHRMLIAAFIEEIIKGNRKLFEFARKNMTRHVAVVANLLKQCQEKGYIVKTDLLNIAPILIGSIALPNIIIRILEKNYKDLYFGLPVALIRDRAISDKAIKERVDFVLGRLKP
jgi:TetR/AcrR family transcriptional regulator, transcriptional repressor for nem operon